MATFAKSTFNASVYSASRPTYPPKLFEYVFNYHRQSKNAKWERAVDLGCGTGQATVELNGPFSEIIGIEPSEAMLQKARTYCASRFSSSANGAPAEEINKLRFVQGSAENLKNTLEDDSVDLLISAQAAHWFDWSKVWPETLRVLRPGGSVAFWVYSEMRFPSHPSLTPLITNLLQGSDDPKTTLGPHFERPGRTILERLMVDVPDPIEGLGDTRRVYFSGDYHPSLVPAQQTLPVLMKSTMKWRDMLGYIRSFSALHNYHEKYPEDLEKSDDPRFPEDLEVKESGPAPSSRSDAVDTFRGGDIAIRFWKDLREGARKDGANVGVDDDVDVEWPVALLLTRKKMPGSQ